MTSLQSKEFITIIHELLQCLSFYMKKYILEVTDTINLFSAKHSVFL